ncbi:MAG: 16S rRNA (cytidine(1402)-2'-O)-methyltransferase [Aeromicrobium sp.]|jgi:16S rRNA (cytidine1402-2'-O)-methyltransferase|nr:16S rRNA (cytidine(1402)-2'-O)-methyltransferase [Aeromicrobium sp.]
MNGGAGTLLVCATPIGNLGDVTLRVLDALRTADAIAAEDTRVTRKLLSRYEIHTPLEAYHEHNRQARTPEIVGRIERGERIALVSDAGTPGISDPGAHLVDACLDAGLRVEVLPGPSAIVTALVASGLPTDAFYFGGFLPRKPGERARALERLAQLDATLVFYESPGRTPATLVSLAESFPGRRAALARELTKLHEEVARASVEELAAAMVGRQLKGEVVLLVGPPDAAVQLTIDEDVVRQRLTELEAAGRTRRDAIREVASETGLPRNEVYRISVATSS